MDISITYHLPDGCETDLTVETLAAFKADVSLKGIAVESMRRAITEHTGNIRVRVSEYISWI